VLLGMPRLDVSRSCRRPLSDRRQFGFERFDPSRQITHFFHGHPQMSA
jgi:hypothetical protein